MNHCTDKTQRWPDMLADVSPDNIESFINHAQDCVFHARVLRAEEDKALSGFSLARGFEGHGRILEGAALKDAIDELLHHKATTSEAEHEGEFPFKRICLTNC